MVVVIAAPLDGSSQVDPSSQSAASGAVELNLISQDTTDWGKDLPGEKGLASLLPELAAIDGVRWVFAGGEVYEFVDVRPRSSARGAHQHAALTSPMPATVRRVQRVSHVETNVRLATHGRPVCEARIGLRVRNDERLITQDRVRAERSVTRHFA